MVVCDDEFPSPSANILVPLEDFNLKGLDLEFDSVKEYALIETSSSSHCPLCSTICGASTCNEDAS